MQNFKFTLLSIIILALLGLIGFWAIKTLEPGSLHAEKQKRAELEEKNRELEKEIEELKDKLAVLEEDNAAPITPVEPSPAPTPTPTTAPATTNSKYQSLISDLQKLVDDKIVMKEKSKGTRVGTLQTFLNIYNNTSKKVDNDYGASTKTAVAAFQKAVGLTADGQAGTTTFQKMIDWLKSNS